MLKLKCWCSDIWMASCYRYCAPCRYFLDRAQLRRGKRFKIDDRNIDPRLKSSLPKPFKVIIRIWLTARKYPFSNNNESVPVHLSCFLSSIIDNTSQDFNIYMSNTASFLKERGLLAFVCT